MKHLDDGAVLKFAPFSEKWQVLLKTILNNAFKPSAARHTVHCKDLLGEWMDACWGSLTVFVDV